MKVEIIICIILILVAIFYKSLYKLNVTIFGESNPRNWHFENEKTDKIVTIVIRIVLFVAGLIGLNYIIFFNN